MSSRTGWLAVLVVLGTLLPAGTAAGHASGQVPHARLSSEGRADHVEWSAAPADAADIGVAVGFFPEATVWAYVEGQVEGYPTDREIAVFSGSRELRTYLLDHVQVRQAGRSCPGQVDPGDDFLSQGARFVFACPDPVEHADIRITILHDRDRHYRTFTVDGTEQFQMHTASQPEHPWDFTLAHRGRPAIEPALIVGIAGVVVVLAGGAWAYRPQRSRRDTGS